MRPSRSALGAAILGPALVLAPLPVSIVAPALVPAAHAAETMRLPAHETYTLANGLTVTTMPLEGLPLVTIRLDLVVGSADDPPGREGLASLTARLLTKGTSQRSATEFAEAVEFVGGSLDASAGRERTVLAAEFLSEHLPLALELVAGAARQPVFAAEEVERARDQALAEIQGVLDEPFALATDRFREWLFSGHPLGHPVLGTAAGVKASTRREVKEFHERHFTPGNAHLVVVGRFETAALRTLVEERFGSWPRADAAPRRVPAPAFVEGRRVVLVDKPEVTQTQIRFGNVGIPRDHRDYFPVLVANIVLGGGFTSRLVNEVRVNRGLTYSISSGFAGYKTTGVAQINTFTKNETVRETIDVVLEELRKMRESGPTPDELAGAKNYAKGSFTLSLEAPEDLAETVADIRYYGLPEDYVETYWAKVDAVTLEEAHEAMRRHLPLENALLVLVTNAAATRAQVEGLGEIEVVSLQ